MASNDTISKWISHIEERLSKLEDMMEREGIDGSQDTNPICTAIKNVKDSSIQEQRKLKELLAQRLRFDKSFGRLPFDLRFHVMRHTPPKDIKNLVKSGDTTGAILKLPRRALWRGMEVEQFSELDWAFGNSLHRSSEQKQAVKGFLATGILPQLCGSMVFEACRKVDNGTFDGWLNVDFLQKMLDLVDHMVENSSCMSRRTLLCVAMLEGRRVDSVENDAGQSSQGQRPFRSQIQINLRPMTIDERIDLFDRQPAAVQVQIREVFEEAVMFVLKRLDKWAKEQLFPSMMGPETAQWMKCYFSPDKVDRKMEWEEMGPWIGYLAAGHIFERMFLHFGDDCLKDTAEDVWGQEPCFHDALDAELTNSGSADGFWREGRRFAKHIGFDWKCILRDSAVDLFLDVHRLRSQTT